MILQGVFALLLAGLSATAQSGPGGGSGSTKSYKLDIVNSDLAPDGFLRSTSRLIHFLNLCAAHFNTGTVVANGQWVFRRFLILTPHKPLSDSLVLSFGLKKEILLGSPSTTNWWVHNVRFEQTLAHMMAPDGSHHAS
jgi:hypothetical protein